MNLTDKMVEAARRVVETYTGFEDGDGEPCPDIAALSAALSAMEGETGTPSPVDQTDVGRLRTERDEWKALATEFKGLTEEWQARAEELEGALKPFARIADMEERAGPSDSVIVNVSRCRDARAALAASEGSE